VTGLADCAGDVSMKRFERRNDAAPCAAQVAFVGGNWRAAPIGGSAAGDTVRGDEVFQ